MRPPVRGDDTAVSDCRFSRKFSGSDAQALWHGALLPQRLGQYPSFLTRSHVPTAPLMPIDVVPASTRPTRRVLMVAFHFPPLNGSSGIQRTLRFVQNLPAFSWQPIVLSASPRAYESTSGDLMSEVPPETVVKRAFALDSARHLSVAGHYSQTLALPDRWATWALGAVPVGLNMIRKYRPDAIWSTYPIATAHRIALLLHRITGVPLVADFRDPMAQDGYPVEPRTWRAFDRIERSLARSAARLVFVTPSACELYRSRYSELPSDRFVLIENGYDEESFAAAESSLDTRPLNEGCVTLLHSGIVYPAERDPRAFFQALGELKRTGRANATTVRIRFRAPVHANLLDQLAAESQTQDLIEVLPPIPYREALQEMLRADGLIVMQGSNCNEQIPAKLYEYVRSRRPILGLADPRGDTGKVMREFGVAQIARLEDPEAVASAMAAFLQFIQGGAPFSPCMVDMSRFARAGALAKVLAEATVRPSGHP
jgi:glycosyltransferase involved in cell wall biosynthesis